MLVASGPFSISKPVQVPTQNVGVVEASELEIAPGQWPERIAVNFGPERVVARKSKPIVLNEEVVGFFYVSPAGILKVFND